MRSIQEHTTDAFDSSARLGARMQPDTAAIAARVRTRGTTLPPSPGQLSAEHRSPFVPDGLAFLDGLPSEREMVEGGKNRAKWPMFAAIGVAAVALVGVVGARLHNENVQNATVAANVAKDPTVTMFSNENGDPATLTGMIGVVDPKLPQGTLTYEAVYQTAAASANVTNVNEIDPGTKFEVPKVPGEGK